MRRAWVISAIAAAAVLAGVAPTARLGVRAESAAGTPGPAALVRGAAAFALSQPVRSLGAPGTSPAGRATPALPELGVAFPAGGEVRDPVVQRATGTGALPAPLVSFDGIPQITGAGQVVPPDTVGEVGPGHYVQMVNSRFAVFDKTGRVLAGPTSTQELFEPLGGVCGVTDRGDPVVFYDQLADRWVLTQFGFIDVAAGPYYECIAVSSTGDPTGEYYLYAFEISDTALNDYPKFGVWPDAYYMSANMFDFAFDGSARFVGAMAVAFERERMLAGDPDARLVLREVPLGYSLLPADLDGPTPPPPGSPGYFLELGFDEFAGFVPELDLFRFRVDWEDPAASTFSGPTRISTAPYDAGLCAGSYCIPQPGTFSLLDPLSDRLMHRLAYRNLAGDEALVVNHTVDAGTGHAGVRWYEIHGLRGTPVVEQGTYAPDDDHRWMGSIAMDGNGNLALGYSVSGPGTYPSVRYTGRLAADTPGEMTLGEGSLVEGAGSQTFPFGRWGDYSAMTVDPVDDCTFWYTQEYYATTSTSGWATRSFAQLSGLSLPWRSQATTHQRYDPASAGALSVTVSVAPVAGPKPLATDFTFRPFGR